MLSSLNTTKKGIVIAFCGFTSFATADASAKWLGMHYDVLHVIFWTYYISLIIGLCFSSFLGGIRNTIKTKRLPIHIGRGVCALGIALCVVSALKGDNALPLSTLYTILFLAPFLITIAARPIYKEKVTAKNWVIIACGFSGILVAFRFGLTNISVEMMYAFLALIFIVALSLFARPLNHEETLLSLSFFPNITTLFLLGIFLLPEIPLPQTQHMPVFLLNGICVTVGLSAIAYGFRIAPYAIIAPLHYTQMVIALIAGYIVFGDIPDIWMVTGAAIIIASGIMLVLSAPNNQDAS
ncbi:MAG: DMT family transporter [Alphaproteobacteria bacterium]